MLVVGDADVVVAVVVRLVVVGREVVVFFVVVGALELLGVAMTAAAGCSCLVPGPCQLQRKTTVGPMG